MQRVTVPYASRYEKKTRHPMLKGLSVSRKPQGALLALLSERDPRPVALHSRFGARSSLRLGPCTRPASLVSPAIAVSPLHKPANEPRAALREEARLAPSLHIAFH